MSNIYSVQVLPAALELYMIQVLFLRCQFANQTKVALQVLVLLFVLAKEVDSCL